MFAGALLTAGSATTPTGAATPDPCAGSLRSITDYETAFARLAEFGAGWATADGYVPVRLPDGRTAWLMSDTLLAPPAVAEGAPATFVHNSIVVQRGRCLTPALGGNAADRRDLVPEVDGRACWQSSGVARGDTLVVFCTLVEAAEGPPGFGFRVVGTAIASYQLPGLTLTSVTSLPFVEPAGVSWGSGAVLVDEIAYVYGATAGNAYVARVPFERVATGSWTFWTGTTWGARDALAAMTFPAGTPSRPVFVTASGAGFVAVGFPNALPDPTIAGWTASRPQGPWRARGVLATATVQPGQFPYDARATELPGIGWTVVYNVNDPVAVATDPDAYGGRFVQPARRGQGATSQGATSWWKAT